MSQARVGREVGREVGRMLLPAAAGHGQEHGAGERREEAPTSSTTPAEGPWAALAETH